ncbi:hypothetical protein NPIL_329201 [Nephila pilipes]|uniref:Uncharacterized protein n=1 Tax=Nephila pilipes TaxID=299642 RepID=A0A8X6UHS0_NEPPI|nr:hypothetical protein NPIL_329201 [Nephila pilipes]
MLHHGGVSGEGSAGSRKSGGGNGSAQVKVVVAQECRSVTLFAQPPVVPISAKWIRNGGNIPGDIEKEARIMPQNRPQECLSCPPRPRPAIVNHSHAARITNAAPTSPPKPDNWFSATRAATPFCSYHHVAMR